MHVWCVRCCRHVEGLPELPETSWNNVVTSTTPLTKLASTYRVWWSAAVETHSGCHDLQNSFWELRGRCLMRRQFTCPCVLLRGLRDLFNIRWCSSCSNLLWVTAWVLSSIVLMPQCCGWCSERTPCDSKSLWFTFILSTINTTTVATDVKLDYDAYINRITVARLQELHDRHQWRDIVLWQPGWELAMYYNSCGHRTLALQSALRHYVWVQLWYFSETALLKGSCYM